MTRILKVVSLICFFGFDFGHAAYRSYYLIDAGSSVIAHLGGTITGVLLGFIVLKDVNVERWEKLLKVGYASFFMVLPLLMFMLLKVVYASNFFFAIVIFIVIVIVFEGGVCLKLLLLDGSCLWSESDWISESSWTHLKSDVCHGCCGLLLKEYHKYWVLESVPIGLFCSFVYLCSFRKRLADALLS